MFPSRAHARSKEVVHYISGIICLHACTACISMNTISRLSDALHFKPTRSIATPLKEVSNLSSPPKGLFERAIERESTSVGRLSNNWEETGSH